MDAVSQDASATLGLSEEGCDGLADLVRPLLEVDTACEAAGTTRNGFRERRLETQVGTTTLRMSKLRQGAYFPDCLVERWSRVARIVICAVVETYALGVSTRKVVRVLERMEPTGFPKTRSRASTRRSMLKWQSCARISCRPYNSLPLGRRDLRALQEKRARCHGRRGHGHSRRRGRCAQGCVPGVRRR